MSNIKDILAFGFNPEKTFVFLDTEYIQYLYPNFIRVQKHINLNNIKKTFGFDDSQCVGKFAYPPLQACPAFSNSFPHIFGTRKNVPCLIPAAIDQDPYFRMTRDIATKLKYQKPASIYSIFFPALQGLRSKMSSSVPSSGIFMTDKPVDIKNKVNKYAFSGGGVSVEEHREKGGDIEVDVPYQWLRFFLEDDAKLAQIAEEYSSGKMMTGEIKKILIETLQKFVKDFQETRAKITDETVKHFMSIRKIEAMPDKFVQAKQEAAQKPAEAKVVAQQPKEKERTFIMIKPDGVQRGLVGKIIQRFEKKGFKLAAMKICAPGKAHLEKHYADLSKKPFFGGLVEYMSSGPVCAMVWVGDNAVATGRKMLGATKPQDSAPGTIRGDFCIDVGRNICHGSDSVESANAEIKLWF